MAKIYAPPKGFTPPDFCKFREDISKYFDACRKYEIRLKEWVRKNYKSPLAGKEISFPVGDGKARYIVASLKPVRLLHIDTGDGYQFQYAHRLTAEDVREEIRKSESLRDMFSKGKGR